MSDCIISRCAHNTAGYGVVWVEGKLLYAHRIAYEDAHGDIPEGLNVCHTCDVPPCINTEHLFLGTQADNVADMVRKGRARGGSMLGESNPAAKLTTSQVHQIRNDRRPSRRVAADFEVSKTQVLDIRNKKSWSYL